MVLVECTLTNRKNNYAFYFRGAAPVRNNKNQPVISVPLIGTDPDNTFLFRFFGQSETLSFTFAIFDDDTDVSGGTYTSTVKTIEEQIEYLRDVIYGASYDTDWSLGHDRFYGTPIRCVITDLNFDNAPGSANVVVGSITLQRGSIGNL